MSSFVAAVIVHCIRAPSFVAMSYTELLMQDSIMDSSSWDAATQSFDNLIDSMPLGVVVYISRAFDQLFHGCTGRHIWGNACQGSPLADEHWRMGLKVFMRVQCLQCADRDMWKAANMFEELHAKAMELGVHVHELHQTYPDISKAACERMLCLMSDIDQSMHLEVKPHVWDIDGNQSIALQVWKEEDSLEKLTVFVFAESAPGSAMQDIPCVMFNKSRKNAAKAIWASLPENGFMTHRDPKREIVKFLPDMYDTQVRMPVAEFLRMLYTHQQAASRSSTSAVSSSTHASVPTSAPVSHAVTRTDDEDALPSQTHETDLNDMD